MYEISEFSVKKKCLFPKQLVLFYFTNNVNLINEVSLFAFYLQEAQSQIIDKL